MRSLKKSWGHKGNHAVTKKIMRSQKNSFAVIMSVLYIFYYSNGKTTWHFRFNGRKSFWRGTKKIMRSQKKTCGHKKNHAVTKIIMRSQIKMGGARRMTAPTSHFLAIEIFRSTQHHKFGCLRLLDNGVRGASSVLSLLPRLCFLHLFNAAKLIAENWGRAGPPTVPIDANWVGFRGAPTSDVVYQNGPTGVVPASSTKHSRSALQPTVTISWTAAAAKATRRIAEPLPWRGDERKATTGH